MKNWLKKLIFALFLPFMASLMSACSQPSGPDYEIAVPEAEYIHVEISELMASNKAALCVNGSFPDWLELYNSGAESASLSGFILSDGKVDWTMPQLTLGPGEYRLLLCSDAGGDGLTVPFSLSKNGETLTLKYPDGKLLDRFEYSSAQGDVSLVKDGAGEVVPAEFSTPGYENSESGYEAFQSSLLPGPLAINEAMTYNAWYLPLDGQYYDWVELKNVSSQPILLSDYYISDDDDDLLMYRLPELTLAPGGLYTLLCGDGDGLELAAPFGLSSTGDELYITSATGSVSDYCSLRNLKYGGSFGRMDGCGGFFFFDVPSPGEENSGGARLISSPPAADTPQGVYDGVGTLSVSLNGNGDIYYTLDGSMPTASSQRYAGPFSLSATAVIRCVSVESGKLASPPLTLSYIINEGHTLPVLSLIAEPDDLFGGRGIYSNPTQDWERGANVALFDGDSGFALDCGMKLHGATSREAQAKKSFKLKFKDRYGGSLSYDLFGNGVTDFSSILLRAAQESTQSTNIRDILMHELASQCSDVLPTQSYKFSVLYINGEYWGVYAMREAHSPEHYAAHFGYSADSVTMTKASWGKNSPLEEAYNYAYGNDMRSGETYAYLQTLMDMDNIIDWQIIQSYSGNMDINPPNLRFYVSSEDNIARYALVDLDLGFFNTGTFELAYAPQYKYSYLLGMLRLNEAFRLRTAERLSEYLSGPLSDENVISTLHSLSSEISSELPRDAQRWGYDVESVEGDLYYMELRLTLGDGMAKKFANEARSFLNLSAEEWHKYFYAFDS